MFAQRRLFGILTATAFGLFGPSAVIVPVVVRTTNYQVLVFFCNFTVVAWHVDRTGPSTGRGPISLIALAEQVARRVGVRLFRKC